MNILLKRVLVILLLLFVLFIQVLIEPYLRWFSPDIFFLVLLYMLIVYRILDFVVLVLASVFFDVFTSNTFGATLLSLAITFYFMELARFHSLRFSFFSSSVMVLFFYMLYILIQHIIGFGVEGLIDTSTLYLFFQMLTTTSLWMLFWKVQARHG